MFRVVKCWLLGCVALCSACGADPTASQNPRRVGPAGGIYALDEAVVLEVPPGAVEAPVEMTFDRLQDGPVTAGAVPGTLLRLGPEGLQFKKPVTLKVRYAKRSLPRENVVWLRMTRVLPGGKAGSTQFVFHDRAASTLSAAVMQTGSYQLADLELAHATVLTQKEPIKDVDVLFVVDNSYSMAHEQANLAANLPRFIEKLEQAGLNYHVGVVSTDLGGGDHYASGQYDGGRCKDVGGDGGKLQQNPRAPGCTPPTDPWLAKIEGKSNVPGGDVAAAFSCIAQIGVDGCGWENTLEAARRALDPTLNINPGFLREDAALAVVFVTDEDDCSAKNLQLYDPNQSDPSSLLGPLSSFRCFEFGVQCDINDRTQLGPRKGCKPGHPAGHDYLHDVAGYETFFKGLKPPGRVMVAAIAAPTDPVTVIMQNERPALAPSCQLREGDATPAIRIQALMDSFGARGHFNTGKDADGNPVEVNICSEDFSPALGHIGDLVTTRILTSWCLPFRPVDTNPLTPDLEADCVVVGAKAGSIPACTAGSTGSCFKVEEGHCGPDSAALHVDNITTLAEIGHNVHVSCIAP